MTAEFIAEQSQSEILCGDWQVVRYAWKLENIQPLAEPFAVKGKQGFFSITATNQQLLVQEKLTCNNPSDACTYDSPESEKPKSKASDLWYTPGDIAELMVRALVKIDLDPCADDGKHIPATLHYTASDDGLSKEWHGRVFMNPPYSCPGKWMKKLQVEFEAGRVTEAIALVPAATETNWLSPFLKTNYVYFWKGRIKFLDANYQTRLSARQAHVLVYWGSNPQRFKEVFFEYGEFHQPSDSLESKAAIERPMVNTSSADSQLDSHIDEAVLTVDDSTISTEGSNHAVLTVNNSTISTGESSHAVLTVNNSTISTEGSNHAVLTVNNSTISTGGSSHAVLTVNNSTISTESVEAVEHSQNSTAINKRRSRGEGTGRIQWRTITKKNGKQYQQAWYDWQLHIRDKAVSKSTYIPKRLLNNIQELEAKKATVIEILSALNLEI
ncbi:MAG: hypothetical protein KME64_41435 [Scytonematopsis contorta HA4267-MV1]|nr:hypothetical protein [Scytonematopsis contorta HA4267-MV1]